MGKATQRTPGQVYVDIQDVEAEILLAAFHGYPAGPHYERFRRLTAEHEESLRAVKAQ